MVIRDISTIGFIGLGVMGEAMCRNLIRKGAWMVVAHDIAPEPLARVAELGAEAARSVQDVCRRADLVITCLPGGAEVRELVLAPQGLLRWLKDGQVLIDMSTSPPALMREIAKAARARDVNFADAPIARTRKAAVDGTLLITVGAQEELFRAILPVLSELGSDVVRCGGPGTGQVVKIMNNMVLFQTVAALAEALEIAEAAGVEGARLLELLGMGSADSFALRNHGAKSLLPRDFPEKAFSVKYAAKDLSYALELAEAHGIYAPGAGNVAGLFTEAIEAGDGERYFPVIRRQMKAGELD